MKFGKLVLLIFSFHAFAQSALAENLVTTCYLQAKYMGPALLGPSPSGIELLPKALLEKYRFVRAPIAPTDITVIMTQILGDFPQSVNLLKTETEGYQNLQFLGCKKDLLSN